MDPSLAIVACFALFIVAYLTMYYFDQRKKNKVLCEEDEYKTWEKKHGVDRVKRREK